jgi:hypothetical protein
MPCDQNCKSAIKYHYQSRWVHCQDLHAFHRRFIQLWTNTMEKYTALWLFINLLLLEKSVFLKLHGQVTVTSTGWGGQSWTKMFFLCTGLHVFLKLMVALKSTDLLCAGLLANHLFNFTFIFLSDGVLVAVRMSGRSCRCIPPLTGPIPWRWTNVGRPD